MFRGTKHLGRALAAAAALVISAHASLATTVTYSDRSSWESAVGAWSNVGFEGITPSNSYVYQGTSTTIDGVTFDSASGMYVIGESYAEGGGNFCTGTGSCLFGYASGITATLASDTAIAIGFDLRGYLEATTTFDISLSNGESFTLAVSNPTDGGSGGGFFGVIVDSPILSFAFVEPQSSYVVIDNFSYATATASVPLPAGLPLLLTGVGIFGLRRKRHGRVS